MWNIRLKCIKYYIVHATIIFADTSTLDIRLCWIIINNNTFIHHVGTFFYRTVYCGIRRSTTLNINITMKYDTYISNANKINLHTILNHLTCTWWCDTYSFNFRFDCFATRDIDDIIARALISVILLLVLYWTFLVSCLVLITFESWSWLLHVLISVGIGRRDRIILTI